MVQRGPAGWSEVKKCMHAAVALRACGFIGCLTCQSATGGPISIQIFKSAPKTSIEHSSSTLHHIAPRCTPRSRSSAAAPAAQAVGRRSEYSVSQTGTAGTCP